MSDDHEVIWLEPKVDNPDGYGHEGRLWCQDDVWDEGGVRYVRADLFDQQAARIKALEAALTPSAETKAAYMGEFRMPWPDRDEDGTEYIRMINVPWTTIKEIMTTVRARALLGGSNG